MDSNVGEDWPWFRDLVGASFKGHTAARLYCDDAIEERSGLVHAGPLAAAPGDAESLGPAMAMTSWEPAVMHIEDPDTHPRMRTQRMTADGLTSGTASTRTLDPRVRVLATVDESTYEPSLGAMGDDHPGRVVAGVRRWPIGVQLDGSLRRDLAGRFVPRLHHRRHRARCGDRC